MPGEPGCGHHRRRAARCVGHRCAHPVYNDRGLGVVLARRQTEGQHVSAKIDRLTQLVANAPEPTQTALNAKIAVLTQHRAALGAKRHRINRDIAFDFAKTVTTMATASAVGVIAVEDLRGLQAGGRGRTNNNRVAQSARRQAYRVLEHTAARAGLEVVMCPRAGPQRYARAVIANWAAPTDITAPAVTDAAPLNCL